MTGRRFFAKVIPQTHWDGPTKSGTHLSLKVDLLYRERSRNDEKGTAAFDRAGPAAGWRTCCVALKTGVNATNYGALIDRINRFQQHFSWRAFVMNNILMRSKFISRMGTFILLLIVPITSLSVSTSYKVKQLKDSPIISAYMAAQSNPLLNDEDKIRATIDAYFRLRYEGQKLLKAQDFSNLIEDNEQPWVKKEKDKRDIELHIASLFQLNYVDYDFTLDYDAFEIKNGTASVQLRESHEVVFEAAAPYGIVSKLANLHHTISLHKMKDAWVITRDEYQDETTWAMDHHTKEDLLNQVDKNYQVNLSQRNFSIGPKVLASVLLRPFSLTNYSYNRTSAKNYADLYWNGTGPYYLREPGDCTNFVSQALYAGEGKNPTNTSGMTTDPNRSYYTDWYYVWNNSGSLPWTQVDTQYNFITGNTNKIGPYGSGTTGYCNVQVGDVVQLYDSSQNPPWFHEAIISVVSNPCAGLQFYYADAHTTDRFQYPVINWSIYQLRYIKVSGWRGN